MRIFDTRVQQLKYEVLRELIRAADRGKLQSIYHDIPRIIMPGPKASLRCCIYKERAILEERLRMAQGGDPENPNIVEVIDIACDECPADGILVTQSCRGCISHRCMEACPKDAIHIIDKRAVVDKDKCIECGKCVSACPYNAIIKQTRPCVRACPADAITIDGDKKAVIDNDKCIACGACLYQCPFGAIVDKSMIMEAYDILKESDGGKNFKTYVVVAPSIVSQFKYAKIEQVVTGIKQLGIHQVVEAAMGADICLYHEAQELKEKGTLFTGCCPSFVMYVQKNFPELAQYISHTLSPMMQAAKLIKGADPAAKVIFIGPCSSKKSEYKQVDKAGIIDCVLSFEELQAFLDARNIDVSSLEETPLDNASYYGRIFAKSGGIAEGVVDVGKAIGIDGIRPVAMNGIAEVKANMLKLKFKRATENFFEGMACEGGCINGALCLTHGPKNAKDVDAYGQAAKEKDVFNSVNLFHLNTK